MLDKLKENWILIISSLAVIIFLFVKNSDILTKEDQPSQASLTISNAEAKDKEAEQVGVAIVDIKGEVSSPGVYEVDPDSRINDVIELAGGFTDRANELLVNLAQKVQDEMTIIVPSNEIDKETAASTNETGHDKVNINYATQEEIESLSGIGPSKAAAIIQYREEHGFFQKPEDLLEVSGIGEKTLENLIDDLQIP